MGSIEKTLSKNNGVANGFTVIEALVAMVIFGVAVLGLAIGATTVVRANQTSLYTTIATNLAQDRLEELKSRTAGTINTTGSPENKTASGVTFTRSWTVNAAGVNSCPNVSGLICIAVTVNWRDYAPHSVVISSAVKQ
jgi:prepilin-type N-terminal cleavage/methylation domain-containing protein